MGKQVTRRHALAASLAAPYFLTSRALGAEGKAPASDVILTGHIGVGGMGSGHLGYMLARQSRGDVNVVAVCDVDENRLAAAVKSTGGKATPYRDYRYILERADVDAVVIATPDHWHAVQTVHACEAGKHVYVEKPACCTIEEGKAMVRAARENRVAVQVGSQGRSQREAFYAHQYIANGMLGRVHTVKCWHYATPSDDNPVPDSEPPPELDYDMWLGPAPWRPYNKNRVHYLFRFFWDYSGGQMTNWGAHHLDITQWALNMDHSGPVEISGRAEFNKEGLYETPEWFEVTYRYANGVRVICGNSHRIGTTFEGQDGILYVDRGRLECTVKGVLEEPLGENEVHLEVSRDHHQNWLDAIKSRKPPICDVAIGHRSATVCHLGNIAILTGRTIRWDPEQEQIVGDPVNVKQFSYEYRRPWALPKLA